MHTVIQVPIIIVQEYVFTRINQWTINALVIGAVIVGIKKYFSFVQSIAFTHRAIAGIWSVALSTFVVTFEAVSVDIGVVGVRTTRDAVTVVQEILAYASVFHFTRSRIVACPALGIARTASFLVIHITKKYAPNLMLHNRHFLLST